MRNFFKAIETGDFAARDAMVDPDGLWHGLTGDSRLGTARTSIADICPMCAALPDLRIAIDLMVAERDLVTVQSTWTGTFSGNYRGMTIKTPKPVNIYRIANGRIVENWASSDRLALAEQLRFALTPGAARSEQLPPALEAVISESHEALRKILNGDPSGYAALFADRDDITLGNPFGPFGKGRAAVLKALGNAATKYTDGSVVKVDRVAVYGSDNLIVLVEIEHDRAKLGDSKEFAEFAARVTSVYEEIGGRWKLVHRHADPITGYRPAESMMQK